MTTSLLLALSASALGSGAFAGDLAPPAPLLAAADRCAKTEPLARTPEIPGGDIFGFTSPTDIGEACGFAMAAEFTGRAGKRDGSYRALGEKTQFAYTYSDRLAFAVSGFANATRWSGVSVAQDALDGGVDGVNRTAFDGVSAEIAYRLIARAPGQPLALTLSAEPRWSRVDGLTGWRAQGYGAEFKLFADVALGERLFAAMNLNYALGTAKLDRPGAQEVRSSATNVSAALTAQVYAADKQAIEGVFVGIEGRFLSAFDGLGLARNVGNGLFVGPTAAIAFSGGRMLNFAWSPQVSGQARPAAAPGSLDLDCFERHQFRVKFATPLGG